MQRNRVAYPIQHGFSRAGLTFHDRTLLDDAFSFALA